MLAGLDETAREDAWREIASELKRFEQNGAFSGTCELLVAAATSPRS